MAQTKKSAATVAPVNFPEWTEYKEKNGLDPLGMQNSSVNLYQTFLPGISNVTLRMRYYGLYAWLCRTYAREVGDTNPETWKRYIRRTEALYALICSHTSTDTGVAGIDWASRILESTTGSKIDFRSAAEPGSDHFYLKQAWGAYGAAYGSQLQEIGLIERAEGHEIAIPTKYDKRTVDGERLADAFARTLGALENKFFQLIDRGVVTKNELTQFAFVAPSEIPSKGSERTLYQDLLLGDGQVSSPRALSRRLSLLLVLRIAQMLGRAPSAEEVRWILYASADIKGAPFGGLPPELELQRQRWQVYQANDLCHVSLEALLKFVLDTLGSHPNGLLPAKLITQCVDEILDEADTTATTWNEFLAVRKPSANAYSSQSAVSDWSLAQELLRGAGRSDKQVCPPDIAWKAIHLLAILHIRARADHTITANELGQFDSRGPGFRSLLTETRFLEANGNISFRELLGRILDERVVRRHLWVALQKFRGQRDYTFLIETDDGRLRLRDKDGPVLTTPRLGPAISFLWDINLIGEKGLTPAGLAVVGAT